MTPPVTAAGFESPSLARAGTGPAFELKFLLTDAAAAEVEAWARRRLTPDPHGDQALDGAYQTVSLYCDTPGLDVYHRSPGYKRSKYRVRRYGGAGWVFLERKSKSGDRVAKRRVVVPADELPLLGPPLSVTTWAGHWFHRRTQELRLGPACRIAYQRAAYAGSCPESPLRLTLDRHIRGVPADRWDLAPVDDGRPLLTGHVILELKFQSALPAPFKELVAALRLSPACVSKYRLCREAWGAAAAPRREAANA